MPRSSKQEDSLKIDYKKLIVKNNASSFTFKRFFSWLFYKAKTGF
jgi:hypothetical protein